MLNGVFSKEQVDDLSRIMLSGYPDEKVESRRNSNNFKLLLEEKGEEGRRICNSLMEIFCSSGCLDVAAKLLKDEIVFFVDHTAYRFHAPGEYASHISVHVDADFMGNEATTLNFWVPTVDVGETAPSLSFLRPEYDIMSYVAAREEAARGGAQTGTFEDLERIYGAPLEKLLTTPVISAGSILVFHQMAVHGTQRLPNGGGYRLSIEFRVGARNNLPNFYRSGGGSYVIPQRTASGWEFRYEGGSGS